MLRYEQIKVKYMLSYFNLPTLDFINAIIHLSSIQAHIFIQITVINAFLHLTFIQSDITITMFNYNNKPLYTSI